MTNINEMAPPSTGAPKGEGWQPWMPPETPEQNLQALEYNRQARERLTHQNAVPGMQQAPTSASGTGVDKELNEWYKANGIPLPKSISGGAVNQDKINAQRESMTFNAKQVEKANKLAMARAKAQMDFQERMANTRHQREMKDLEKAGLNPILTAMGGSGASVPGGAMAPVQSAKAQSRDTYDYAKSKAEITKLHTSSAVDIKNIITGVLGLMAGLML